MLVTPTDLACQITNRHLPCGSDQSPPGALHSNGWCRRIRQPLEDLAVDDVESRMPTSVHHKVRRSIAPPIAPKTSSSDTTRLVRSWSGRRRNNRMPSNVKLTWMQAYAPVVPTTTNESNAPVTKLEICRYRDGSAGSKIRNGGPKLMMSGAISRGQLAAHQRLDGFLGAAKVLANIRPKRWMRWADRALPAAQWRGVPNDLDRSRRRHL